MSYSDKDKEVIARNLTHRELVDAAKQGYKELVNEYVGTVGRWTLKTFAAAVVGALIVFLINYGGLGK